MLPSNVQAGLIKAKRIRLPAPQIVPRAPDVSGTSREARARLLEYSLRNSIGVPSWLLMGSRHTIFDRPSVPGPIQFQSARRLVNGSDLTTPASSYDSQVRRLR